MKILSCLFCLMIFTGCAVMDLNTMDTAIPIYPDKASLSTYLGLGIDYSSPFFRAEEDTEDDSKNVNVDFLQAFKLGVAVNDDLDAHGKIYQASSSWGAKAGLKKLLYHKDRSYSAIMPMLTYMSANVEHEDDNGEKYLDTYRSYGMEVTGLLTQQISKYFIGTLALRYNLSHYTEDNLHQSYEDILISHGGLTANLRLKVKALFLGLEYGLEVVPNKDADIRINPTMALGIGFQFH